VEAKDDGGIRITPVLRLLLFDALEDDDDDVVLLLFY